jgi:hypothetical protein
MYMPTILATSATIPLFDARLVAATVVSLAQ